MAGFKLWNFKEKLASADVNGYLMKQVIARFDDAGARASAITAPEPNQYTYVDGVGLTRWNGSAWVTEIAQTPASLAPTPINFTTFYSTWSVYSSSYTPPRYYKTNQNIVHIEGMMKAGASSDSNEYSMVLPSGFRPVKNQIFLCMARQAGGMNPAYITVESNGQITPNGPGPWRATTSDWLSLGGIQFLAGA